MTRLVTNLNQPPWGLQHAWAHGPWLPKGSSSQHSWEKNENRVDGLVQGGLS